MTQTDFEDDGPKRTGEDELNSRALEIGKPSGYGDSTKNPSSDFFTRFRFIIAAMAGFSYGAMLFARHNMTVVIVEMIDHGGVFLKANPSKTIDDFLKAGHELGGEFIWDYETQQMILSCYMFSYALGQVPMTKLGLALGDRLAIPLFLSICLVTNILIAPLAYCGWYWVVGLRIIHGFGAAPIPSLMLTTIEKWIPQNETSLALSIAQCVAGLIFACNPLISGYMASIHWTYAFYVPNMCLIGFCISWLCLVSDRPQTNWILSKFELELITEAIESNNEAVSQTSINEGSSQVFKPTWIDIIRLPSFHVLNVLWLFYCGTTTTFSFVVPTYINRILKVDVAQVGFYCTIINFGAMISCTWPVPLMCLLEVIFGVSKASARHIGYTVTCLAVATSWMFVGLFHRFQLAFFFMTRCCLGANEIFLTGTAIANFTNANVTGLAYSMLNTCGNLAVILMCTSIGTVQDQTSQSYFGWSMIFLTGVLTQLLAIPLFFMTRTKPVKFAREEKMKSNKKSGNM